MVSGVYFFQSCGELICAFCLLLIEICYIYVQYIVLSLYLQLNAIFFLCDFAASGELEDRQSTLEGRKRCTNTCHQQVVKIVPAYQNFCRVTGQSNKCDGKRAFHPRGIFMWFA